MNMNTNTAKPDPTISPTSPAPITWQTLLAEEKQQAYFKKIMEFLHQQHQKGVTVYPAAQDIFNAFKFTPFETLKVVIIGQDPYHGANQAHGLSFSVKHGVRPPPSLQNIFTEIKHDLGLPIPTHGCLEKWAKQGVLLLNTILSVEASRPQSHSHLGWQPFTDKVIAQINQHSQNLVFLLWGAHAQQKIHMIDSKRHLVLMAAHPSPFSAHRGFLGCQHFSKANAWLEKHGKSPIDWSLDPEKPNAL